jgi:hypothetical protein
MPRTYHPEISLTTRGKGETTSQTTEEMKEAIRDNNLSATSEEETSAEEMEDQAEETSTDLVKDPLLREGLEKVTSEGMMAIHQ